MAFACPKFRTRIALGIGLVANSISSGIDASFFASFVAVPNVRTVEEARM